MTGHSTALFWTPERIAQLKKLYDDDVDMVGIGQYFGKPRNTCISALRRYYPDRVHRKASRVSKEQESEILALYGRGWQYGQIVTHLVLPSESSVGTAVSNLEKRDPAAFAALRKERKAALEAKGFSMNGRPRCWGKHKKPITDTNAKPFTEIDRAIATLQRYAACYRDPRGRGIVYGRTLKTPDQILALAARKEQRA
jgi:hypothetical protein